MKFPAPLLAAALLALAPAGLRADDTRFSQTLTASELTEAGMKRLSSDQIAVIDALVRRDYAKQSESGAADAAPAARFSQRLTDDERRLAGCGSLSEAELARLDALVAHRDAAARARELLAPPVFIARSPRVRATEEAKTKPEVHGAFSFGMGWGSGGYSEKTGAMMLNFTDPAHNLSISVGYAETHVKGGNYIYREPLAGPPPLAP